MIGGKEQDQKIVLCLPFRNAECFNLEMNCMLCIYEKKGLQKTYMSSLNLLYFVMLLAANFEGMC